VGPGEAGPDGIVRIGSGAVLPGSLGPGGVGRERARPGTGGIPELLYVITGPEGGISEAELAALAEAGCREARLWPEVLRAGVAGPAALAVINHLLGRWAH
ncbi:MAG: 16S rRNA (uracil(1498)-N(3))-methyltransferase, partial [Bifidobacteriaceae bacterium]|jgi:16S rRNA (uracil1498-N3)-methyltransferase|nr:16S rRNA (uracil(1498)-N(3))-methyltransferase [Bifidobacteriaceae bacterium]